MEFWLICDGSLTGKLELLRLPVPPPDYEYNESQNIETQEIIGFGEWAPTGERNLETITLKSFFPAQQYSFCQYTGFPEPYECVERIKRWKNSKKIIRLVITETTVNMACQIEDFKWGEKAGSRDVEFELSLKEYRTLDQVTQPQSSNQPPKKPRPTKTPVKPKTHKVKAGDTLYELAIKYYGNAQRWKDIAKKNNIKNPKKLTIGKVLVLP